MCQRGRASFSLAYIVVGAGVEAGVNIFLLIVRC